MASFVARSLAWAAVVLSASSSFPGGAFAFVPGHGGVVSRALCRQKSQTLGVVSARRHQQKHHGGTARTTALSAEPWPAAYQAFVRNYGAELAVMSWKGYESFGAGCVVAPDGNGVERVIYVPEAKFVVSADNGQDIEGVGQILTRVRAYDPLKQFVVVFTHDGVMGADIVTPNIPPKELSQLPEFADRHVTDTPTVATTRAPKRNGVDAENAIDV